MPVQTSYTEAPAAGLSGDIYGNGGSPHDIEAHFSEEASAEIPFGTAVKMGTAENGALQPTAESDVIIGLVVRSHAYDDTELGDDGVLPEGTLNVMRKGKILVQCDSGCTAGDPLWIRAVAGVGERLGAPENADDSTDTVDCSAYGTWRTTAAAGELAVLEIDFTGSN